MTLFCTPFSAEIAAADDPSETSTFSRHRIGCALCKFGICVLIYGIYGLIFPAQCQVIFSQERKDTVVDAPLAPEVAARTMVVPEGFRVTLFAGEPDCQQPVGFCIDDRGRLWVAEAYNYPNHGTRTGDRILIFEDVDGDGDFDKRTVFYDKLNYVTGIEVGFGGAWVMSPPYFYFIPDRNGDDHPDGPPELLLDGFGNHANAHNVANGFAWGPDGWLYGTHGRTNWSLPAKPGTPKEQRIQFDGGVYRYHPVRHIWEPYADGTTNPWGIDWNDLGEAFICNCVNPHLFHVIQGAHYEPWRNRESSQYAYRRIPTIADHLHYVGLTSYGAGAGTPQEDAAGGGHAHCGTLIYLGDNWPEHYRNTLFTNNIHGRRINNDLLRRHGSGYIAAHGPDLMRSKDPWFMGVTLRTGPDGSVFVTDWSDTGECHSLKNTRRSTGRIYKISYGNPTAAMVNLSRLSDQELVNLQWHRNDWYVQHARRLLQERTAQGHDMSAVATKLTKAFHERPGAPAKLRALWALHVIGQASSDFLIRLLNHDHESVRAWSVRLLCETRPVSVEALARFRELAQKDGSALVRLHLSSILQRLPPDYRWPIAEALVQRCEDAGDDNIPLMIWYGIEPLVATDLNRFIGFIGSTRIPLIARHVGRRVSSIQDARAGLNLMLQQLPAIGATMQSELLAGIIEGLEGRRVVALPEVWPVTYAKLQAVESPAVREESLKLALIFDDPSALEMLRRVAADTNSEGLVRNRAIQALVSKRSDNVAPLLLALSNDPTTRRAAIRGLAEFADPETPAVLLKNYGTYDQAAKQDVTQTLAARLTWATKLVDALEQGQVLRQDITAYTARQLYNLANDKLSARLKTLWGELRTTPAEKTRRIANYKKQMTPELLQRADRTAGRILFQKTCASCHRFFDSGGSIGPDITGSQRTNLDYLLQTLVDPSATVAKDFQMQVIGTTDGRVITGFVLSETEAAITIQTVNEKVLVPLAEVEQRKISDVSMMPEGMLQNLTNDQVLNLVAYLMSPKQAPLADQHKDQGNK